MQNLEQIRAKNAMKAAEQRIAGANGGEVIKKIPPLIINHGLLAIGAYAFDEKTGYKGVIDAIAKHLADPAIALLPTQYTENTDGLMKYLTAADSNALKLCTAEAMAWLNYARRFIKKD
jgi:CRISPR/Cas system CMR-associated protein Cmr5 small subunit